MTYDFIHTPLCQIWVYATSSVFTDLTWKQSTAPSIQKAENKAGSATFTIADMDIISDTFSDWSDNTARAVAPGMRVRIAVFTSDSQAITDIFYGLVSTITLNGETVTIECADSNARLAKAGTSIRRNYRGPEYTGWFSASNIVESGEVTGAYAVLTDTTTDGSAVTPTIYGWTAIIDNTVSGGDRTYLMDEFGYTRKEQLFKWTMPSGGTSLRKVSIRMYGRVSSATGDYNMSDVFAKMTVNAYKDSVVVATYTSEDVKIPLNSGGDQYFTVSPGLFLDDADTIEIIGTGSYSTGAEQDGFSYCYLSSGTGSSVVIGTDTYSNKTMNGTVTWDRLDLSIDLSEEPYVDEDNHWVFKPSDYTTYSADPSDRRLWVRYSKGPVYATDIIQNLCEQCNATFNDQTGQETGTSLALFRAGGGYMADYLGKLCDLTDDTGHMHSYIAWGWGPTVYYGIRHTVDDDPLYCLHYGGEDMTSHTVPSSVGTRTFAFSAFTPNKSIKHNPDLVTYFATVSDGSDDDFTLPVTILNISKGTSRGCITESMSSGQASSWDEAVSTCWSLYADQTDDWTGSVTLPMSPKLRRNISTLLPYMGTYAGSGAPVIIYDKRYGMDGFKAKITEISYDFSACTVTLQLNNYSQKYASDVADAVALAVSQGSNAGVTDTSLYARQYYTPYGYFDLSNGNPLHSCELTAGMPLYISDSAWDSDNHKWLETPHLIKADKTRWTYINGDQTNEWIVMAKFTGTANHQMPTQYGVKEAVFCEDEDTSLNGKHHLLTIDECRCPDLLIGQTLVMCLHIINGPTITLTKTETHTVGETANYTLQAFEYVSGSVPGCTASSVILAGTMFLRVTGTYTTAGTYTVVGKAVSNGTMPDGTKFTEGQEVDIRFVIA